MQYLTVFPQNAIKWVQPTMESHTENREIGDRFSDFKISMFKLIDLLFALRITLLDFMFFFY
jgi:hypothetical protein